MGGGTKGRGLELGLVVGFKEKEKIGRGRFERLSNRNFGKKNKEQGQFRLDKHNEFLCIFSLLFCTKCTQ
jgi:hypothetical protein